METALINRDGPDGLSIQIPTRRSLGWLASVVVWCLGWLLYATLDAAGIWYQLSSNLVIQATYSMWWLLQWIAAGWVAFRALAWVAAGSPETITVNDRVVSLTKGRGRSRANGTLLHP